MDLRFIPWIILSSVSWFTRDTQAVPLVSKALSVPQDVRLNISIANQCVAPDGYPRVAILSGKQGEEHTLPGPIISGNKGDRFFINVTNELTDERMLTGTSIHWHGISQHHSNQMDGTTYVTQCPISPQKSFLYNFTGENQVGTYWYHSHYDVQYCDGLRGPLIIRDPDDPYNTLYDYDNDSTIISLMDWYHYPSPMTPRQIHPDSVLINGTGCYDGQDCGPPVTYQVEAKKRYRFRLLNMACKSFYNFAIDGHNMTIIEVDGEYVEPYTVDSIPIYAGQRYSFVLNADQPVGNYWIRTNPSTPMNATTTAILRYNNALDEDPQTVSMVNSHLNETLLRSLWDPDPRLLQPEPDVRLIVELSKNDSTYNFLINGTQYISPSVPVMLQVMNSAVMGDVDPTGSLYYLPRNQTVEVVFHVNGTGGRPHPFHLHGHHFVVMKSADGEVMNYDMPVIRDTVSTGATDAEDGVTIRFLTDNPGPWILHCHIEWHLYAGMAIVFVEDYPDIPEEQPFSDASRDLCPYYTPPEEDWPLPPVRTVDGPFSPITTPTCTPTPAVNRRSV